MVSIWVLFGPLIWVGVTLLLLIGYAAGRGPEEYVKDSRNQILFGMGTGVVIALIVTFIAAFNGGFSS